MNLRYYHPIYRNSLRHWFILVTAASTKTHEAQYTSSGAIATPARSATSGPRRPFQCMTSITWHECPWQWKRVVTTSWVEELPDSSADPPIGHSGVAVPVGRSVPTARALNNATDSWRGQVGDWRSGLGNRNYLAWKEREEERTWSHKVLPTPRYLGRQCWSLIIHLYLFL